MAKRLITADQKAQMLAMMTAVRTAGEETCGRAGECLRMLHGTNGLLETGMERIRERGEALAGDARIALAMIEREVKA